MEASASEWIDHLERRKAEAVAVEDYELAASLRDQIAVILSTTLQARLGLDQHLLQCVVH